MGSSYSPPPAPDYTAAARQTAADNQWQTTAQTWANRPTINTPWGTSTWSSNQSVDPATGQPVTTWTNDVKLTDAEQAALNQQQALQSGLSSAAAGLLGQATNAFNTPFDTSQFTNYYSPTGPAKLDLSGGPAGPNFQNIQPGMYQAASSVGATTADGVGQVDLQRSVSNNASQIQTGIAGPGQYDQLAMQAIQQRQQPLQDRQRAALQTQLANQGIQQGSEAYTNAMRDLGMQENDANLAAITAGFNQGNTEFNQGLQQGQFRNSALGQQFNQGLQQGQFANDASQNMFNQAATSAQVQNQAAQINNQNNQFNASNLNQANQFNIANSLAAQNANNSLAQQSWQNANTQYLQGNQAQLAQQQAQLDYSNQAAAQRAQQYQEALNTRNLPLNEMNALLNGQQVQQPQFNGPNSTASRAAGADYLQAAQLQNQAAMNAYNAQTGSQNSMTSGLFSLGAAALTAY